MKLKELPREKLLQTLAYYLGFICLGLVMVSSGPHLPNLIQQTNSSMDQFAVIFVVSSFGFLAGSFLGGWLFDRLPGHRIISVCFVVLLITLAVTPLIGTVWLMAVVFFFTALAMSLIDLGSNTLITWVHGDQGGPYMNALHFFFGIGAAISPLLVGQFILATGDIYWSYWTLAALMIPAILMLTIIKSPQIRAETKQSNVSVSRAANRTGLIWLMVIFFMFYVAVESNFGTYIVSYIQRLTDGNTTATAYEINSIYWGMLTLGRLLAIPIAARLKPRAIITINLAGAVIAISTILLFRQSLSAVWAGSIILGLAQASTFPTMLIFAEQQLKLTGRITSYFYLGISLSGMVIPWLIAQFFEGNIFSVMIILGAMIGVQVISWLVINLNIQQKDRITAYELNQ
jgi:MFS transporter, FHS family, Na+ dependent glucose transporter 1